MNTLKSKYSFGLKNISALPEWTGKMLLTVIFSLMVSFTASAQNADDYFHNGAQSFIGADLQDAISYVQEGLAQYPNDPKLNALLQKLEEEQERQQQQQQDQNQQQQNQDEQEQQQQESEQEQDQNQEEQEQQESEGDNGEEEQQQEQETEGLEPQQISKEDAEKILQALAQKEKELLKEFKKQKTDGSAKHEKDW
ncbi:MAG: hypothetical protein WD059_10465 [Balneolaceae bacterium]